jgi:hypothetical protein
VFVDVLSIESSIFFEDCTALLLVFWIHRKLVDELSRGTRVSNVPGKRSLFKCSSLFATPNQI